MNSEMIWALIGAVALIMAAIMAAAVYVKRSPKPDQKTIAPADVTRDWALTGRINVIAPDEIMMSDKDDIPADFLIRVEDSRVVRDIGGGEYQELRWRQPTRKEVKDIVKYYNAYLFSQTKSPMKVAAQS